MQVSDEKRATPLISGLPDEVLMEHVVRGSEAAFATLVDRYKGRVINVVCRFINDRDRAQEIAQEVFLRVFVHRERYRPNGKFSTWIYTIAVNLAKNEIRRRVRSAESSAWTRFWRWRATPASSWPTPARAPIAGCGRERSRSGCRRVCPSFRRSTARSSS